jgi:hypothetical protein
MKIKKEYISLIAVVIILVFLLGLFYFFESNLKNLGNASGNQNNVNSNQDNTTAAEAPQEKTLDFVSVSCLVSGNSDTIKFRIQSTGINIEQGEMASFLDSVAAAFKDSNGNTLDSIALNAGTTSDEFSYTTTDHKDSRKITVSTPAKALDRDVACS